MHAKNIGIQKLSVRTLARAANVSVGTVYNYFPSIHDLQAMLLDDFWKLTLAEDVCRVKVGQNFIDYIVVLFSKALVERENFQAVLNVQLQFIVEDPDNLNTYYVHIKEGLLKVLEQDQDIDPSLWSSVISKVWFIDFVLENMMSQLLKEHPNFTALETIMRKILYKGEKK